MWRTEDTHQKTGQFRLSSAGVVYMRGWGVAYLLACRCFSDLKQEAHKTALRLTWRTSVRAARLPFRQNCRASELPTPARPVVHSLSCTVSSILYTPVQEAVSYAFAWAQGCLCLACMTVSFQTSRAFDRACTCVNRTVVSLSSPETPNLLLVIFLETVGV